MNDISLIKQYMQLFVSHTVARQSHNVRNTHETQAKITAGYISEYLEKKSACCHHFEWLFKCWSG